MSLKSKITKYVEIGLLVYFAIGGIFLIIDAIDKSGMRRELKITVWEPEFDIKYIEDEHKIEQLWEVLNKYKKFKRVEWFGSFKYLKGKCVVSIYDKKTEASVYICKSEKLGWYLEHDVSSVRHPPSYYKLSEEEAKKLIKDILSIGDFNYD